MVTTIYSLYKHLNRYIIIFEYNYITYFFTSMKNKLKILGLFTLLPFFAIGQLTINGATLVVENGATLVVEGKITNTSGVITNDGEIQVKGDFENNGTLTSGTMSKVIFNSDSGDQTVTSNGASFNDVEMATVSGQNVILADNMIIDGELSFSADGLIDVQSNNLTFSSGATVNSATEAPGTNRFVKADGTGQIIRQYSGTADFTFPIGGAIYSPLRATAPSTDPDATIAVNVEETPTTTGGVRPSDMTDFIDRDWDVSVASFGVNDEIIFEGQYDDGDITGTEANINGTFYDLAPAAGVSEWSFPSSTGDASMNKISVTMTGNDDLLLTGTNTNPRQNIMVFLAGPLSGTTMSTALNGGSTGIIASNQLTSPYGGSESVAASFFDSNLDIVDWIKVELRDKNNSSVIVDEYSKFLRNDGTIVNTDGSSPAVFRGATSSDAFVAIKHRNHLGVMLDQSTILGSSNLLDFTSALTTTYGSNAQNTTIGGNAMWAGDANSNGNVLYNGTNEDKGAILFKLLFNPSGIINNAYESEDVNMDGIVLYNGTNEDKGFILFQLLFNTSGIINEQLPE